MNALIIYEGARYTELVHTFGVALGSKKMEDLTSDLGRAQNLPVIRNAQRQLGIDEELLQAKSDAAYYDLDEQGMKIFAEEFGSTKEREQAIEENQAEACQKVEANKKTGKDIQARLKLYQQLITKLKAKKTKVFQDILQYALQDLIMNQKIVLRADRRRMTTLSLQETKKFDLDS